ncbi:MAG: hypothetical protein NTU98_01415 [Bacteroidetes bacterium]|nr:hypothetical protein [Bacteroidota bacterium]
MAKTKSNAIGNTLGRAREMVTYISGFVGYAPPRNEESVAEMQKLLEEITNVNAGESAAYTRMHESISNRVDLFSGSNGSVLHLLVRIRGAVESQYGKKSSEAESIAMLMRKITTYKHKKESKQADATPAEPITAPLETSVSHSRSTRSFSSLYKIFLDMLSTVKEFGNYKPGNPELEIPQLETQAGVIEASINAVATATQNLQVMRSRQRGLYDDLTERVRRIKAYVKAQYGSGSDEFKMIKGIRV